MSFLGHWFVFVLWPYLADSELCAQRPCLVVLGDRTWRAVCKANTQPVILSLHPRLNLFVQKEGKCLGAAYKRERISPCLVKFFYLSRVTPISSDLLWAWSIPHLTLEEWGNPLLVGAITRLTLSLGPTSPGCPLVCTPSKPTRSWVPPLSSGDLVSGPH